MYKSVLRLLVLVVLWQASAVRAELQITIDSGAIGATPIAVVPFSWQGVGQAAPQPVNTIIENDLARSGLFAPMKAEQMLSRPHHSSEVKYQDWRVQKVDYVVVGQIITKAPDTYAVQFQLLDVYKQVQLVGQSITVRGNMMRRAAHRISDLIYQAITGEQGAFETKIAYITEQGVGKAKTYSLQVADIDGYGPQTVLNSKAPIMSPSWSPDANRLAYVSFEQGNSAIWVQDLSTGKRDKVTSYPGINSSPSWSPDGRRLAMTLSKDGNPDIYVLDMATRQLSRVTTNRAIDTEAVWAPDGRSIYFTSDRSGGPQIYRMELGGAERPQRVTFDGNYNARARLSGDGTKLCVVHGEAHKYSAAVYDLKTGLMHKLTEGPLDDAPSFSPNGAMVLYSAAKGDRGVLAVSSADGRVKHQLAAQEGNVKSPSWSPFLH